MSFNYCVTALKSWVEANCPKILEAEYSKFLRHPDIHDEVPYSSLTDTRFLKYCPENIGIVDRTDEYENQGL